ncbi:MAG: hypothetical protein GY696_31860, partial [Gammaproteobacteria bacterium]|nr:hypothetical protein [Gammaproteobacteria bacterium]
MATLYSSPSPKTIQHRDLFVSYEQGADQTLQHYQKVKWGLFEQGWPDPIGRSIAFGIEDTINGFYNLTVRNGLNKERPPTMSRLQVRAVRLVKAERTCMIHCKFTNESWQGLELQDSPWILHPITRKQGGAGQARPDDH